MKIKRKESQHISGLIYFVAIQLDNEVYTLQFHERMEAKLQYIEYRDLETNILYKKVTCIWGIWTEDGIGITELHSQINDSNIEQDNIKL